LLDSEIEWVNPPDAVEAGTRHGPEAFEGAQSSVGRAYSSIGIDVERRVELGDHVGLIVEILYLGRASGIEVRQRMGFVFTIRNGRVVRFEWSNEPEDLLARVVKD
jgi:ketosteroid isomerase-like protein